MTMKCLRYSILVFYTALFVFLALYDERLDPELARELAQPRPRVIEPGNAWLTMLGFDAPAGTPPFESGAERMRDLAKALADGKNHNEIIFASTGESELSFKGELPSFGDRENSGAMAYALNHPAEVAALYRDNSELISRYEQLRSLTSFAEPLEYGYYAPFPHFSPIRSTQRLLFLRLAIRAEQGDLTGALTELRDDMAFWRLVARSSRTLISKLISVALLNSDLKFAAELGSSGNLTLPEWALVRELLQPFAKEDVSLAKTLQGEVLYYHYGMAKMPPQNRLDQWDFNRLITKRTATTNRLYANMRELTRQAALSPRQYAQEQKRQAASKAESFKIGLACLYNPAGEILAIIATPQFSPYIEKMHHLEGLRRLALLKVLAHAERLPPERMQPFLDAHAADLGNPYTGEPMQWDAKNGRIYFSKLSGDGNIELYY
jgi:hypothetical protein